MRLAFVIPFLFFLLFITDFIPSASADERYPFLINLRIEAVDDVIAEVEPLGSYRFTFKYYNGGNFQKNYYAFYVEFEVEVEGEGWQAYVYPTWGYFYPNETKFGYVRVEASARPSNFAYIHLRGGLRDIWGNWHRANYTFQVKSAPYHTFDVKIGENYMKGKQEEIYEVPIKIINYGNYEDRFSVVPEYYPAGWVVTVSQSPLVIPPKGEATVYLQFAIPHEGFYLQHTTYLIRAKVQVEGAGSSKVVSLLVSLEGFHLTLGQAVALLSSFPSILILAFIGAITHRRNNVCTYIPKMWKEEKDELMKMPAEERKKAVKELKEAWKSAIYFCKHIRKDEKDLQKLKRVAERKQRKLKEKIMEEWKQSWNDLYAQWKEECNKIKEEYERRKREIEMKWARADKMARIYGKKIDRPAFPQILYPPEPKKPPLPKIPEYKVDENRRILIEPDEIIIERILMPIRRGKMLAKRDIIKMKEMGNELREKLRADFEAIEKRINAEIEKLEKMKRETEIRERNKRKIEELKKNIKK